MSSQSNQPRDSLRHLSDYTLGEQNLDIYLRTKGHLNERRLWKPPEQRTHQPWTTATRAHLHDEATMPRLKHVEHIFVPNETELIRTSLSRMQLVTLNDQSQIAKSSPPPFSAKFHHLPSTEVASENMSTCEQFKLPLIESALPFDEQKAAEKYGLTDKELAIKVLTGPFVGFNKHEKYTKMAKYERETIGKEDLLISNVLHSNESACYLENKLLGV
jgi:hypothetical protein